MLFEKHGFRQCIHFFTRLMWLDLTFVHSILLQGSSLIHSTIIYSPIERDTLCVSESSVSELIVSIQRKTTLFHLLSVNGESRNLLHAYMLSCVCVSIVCYVCSIACMCAQLCVCVFIVCYVCSVVCVCVCCVLCALSCVCVSVVCYVCSVACMRAQLCMCVHCVLRVLNCMRVCSVVCVCSDSVQPLGL